jgi:hypothetical protein
VFLILKGDEYSLQKAFKTARMLPSRTGRRDVENPDDLPGSLRYSVVL